MRFVTNVLLAVLGAVIAVASQAFSSGTAGWVAFGAGLAILVGLGAAQLDHSRGDLQRLLDVATGLLGVWTVVASVAFAGAALSWL